MPSDIGVVVAAFNGDRFISEQVRSILEQSRSAGRIIIVDDASIDWTTSLILEFIQQHPTQITLLQNTFNTGVRTSFQRGIDACRTDYIALADQDDIWEKNKLEKMLSALDSRPDAMLCFHDLALMDEKGNALGRTFWDNTPDPLPVTGPAARERIASLSNPVPGNTMMFSAELKEHILPMPDSRWIGHDWWISAVAFFLADPIFVPEPLVRYRLHDHQTAGIGLTIKRRRSHLRWTIRLRREIGRLFKPNHRKSEQKIRAHEMSTELLKLLETSRRLKKLSTEEYTNLKKRLQCNLVISK